MTDPTDPLFFFGPGYSATALAARWRGEMFGTVRSEASRAKLSDTQIQPLDLSDISAVRERLNGAHVVISAPPGEEGCPAFAAIGEDAQRAKSITYLSTTGVYGDLDGGWAMEWSAVSPQSERARRRAAAEDKWMSAHAHVRTVRLPGIYGPGRSALDRAQSGKARRIVKPGQVFSRIHVADIASGLHALLLSGSFGVFNLCDEEAAPPQDVVAYAADLLGVAPPDEIAFEAAELSPMGRSFYSECKRVSNARIKAATGWRPQFPTYREGLKSIAETQS